jgi:hypothetical protein
MRLRLHLIKFIRDSTVPQETLQWRQDWLDSVKMARVVSAGLAAFSFGLAILNAYNQHLFPTLGFLALSYASYECYKVSDNIRTILQNPAKEIQAVYSSFRSTKKLWRLLTDEAPLARKVGEYYLCDPENTIQEPKGIRT